MQDERIPYLLEVPSKHKWISVKTFIGEVDLDKYLANVHYPAVDIEAEVQKVLDRKEKMKELKSRKKNTENTEC